MSRRIFTKLPIPFYYTLLIAALLSLLTAAKYIPLLFLDTRFSLYRLIGQNVIDYFLWCFFSPVVYSILHLRYFEGRLSPPKLGFHLVLALLVAVAHSLLTAYLFSLRYLGDELQAQFLKSAQLFTIGITSYIEYWVVFGAFMALDFYNKYRNKKYELAVTEKEPTGAQLTALKMQLHPHFLFNALNTVSALMEESVDDAQRVLARLARLLRTMLDQNQKHTDSLDNEIKYIQDYLTIEQVRFQDRLVIDMDIDGATLAARVPYLILQPLVENAVKHGFSSRIEGGTIKISSRLLGQRLELTVADDGKGIANCDKLPGSGIGLCNVRDRLEQMYPDDYQLNFLSPNGLGFIATMNIPFSTVQEVTREKHPRSDRRR